MRISIERPALLRPRGLPSAAFLLLALASAYLLGQWIIAGASEKLVFAGFAVVAAGVLIVILSNWRSGAYLFFLWLLLEDLTRKYLGNNMLIYFGKDVLVAIVYLSFFIALRRGKVSTIRYGFLLPFTLFFWLGVVQVFNPSSPSILYGLLGLKLYFYYVPLLFVGYALIDTESELHRFLLFNVVSASVVAGLGVVQGLVGPGFLNPAVSAPEIGQLSHLTRMTPISGQIIYRPTSVFVSDGRFAWYLVLVWLLAFGTAGYLLLRTWRGRKWTFLCIGIVTVAVVMSGSRGSLMWTIGGALLCSAAFLWGAPWKQGEVLRVVRAISRAFFLAGLTLVGLLVAYPQALGARWAFYTETLLPSSPASELTFRARDYPLQNLQLAFEHKQWPYGYGIGTNSLGGQYVSSLLRMNPPNIGVENGYGSLIVELGIGGLALWIAWTSTLVISAWGVVRRLRGSPYFPLGFSMFLYASLLLFPFVFGSMAIYQNYIMNAYLWTLVGILFRLPAFSASWIGAQAPSVARGGWLVSRHARESTVQRAPVA